MSASASGRPPQSVSESAGATAGMQPHESVLAYVFRLRTEAAALGAHWQAAQCLYDFEPAALTELRAGIGETIAIAPTELQPLGVDGWLLAAAQSGARLGLIPIDFVHATSIRV